MASLLLDLSGSKGLAPFFSGDVSTITANPERRYLGEDGQMSDGIYNPFKYSGYLSPSNNTYADITGTITAPFISRAYSSDTNTLYLAQEGLVLSTLSGLDDTSLTNETVLAGTSKFNDLELYEVSGNEALFYAYEYSDTSASDSISLRLGYKALDSSKGGILTQGRVHGVLTGNNIGYESISTTTYSKLSQRFKATGFPTTDYTISGIRLRLKVPVMTTQTWTFRVGIQGETSSTDPDGTYVVSTTVAASTLPAGEYGDVYFALATTALDKNKYYHVVIEPTSIGDLDSTESVRWLRTNQSNALNVGTGDAYNGSWNEIDETFDFAILTSNSNNLGAEFEEVGDMYHDDAVYFTAAAATGATGSIVVTGGESSPENTVVQVALFIDSCATDVETETTSITCGGTAMTFIGDTKTSGGIGIGLYYLRGVSVGTHSIVVTLNQTRTLRVVASVIYGVTTNETPYRSNAAFTDTGSSMSHSAVNSGDEDRDVYFVSAIAVDTNAPITPTSDTSLVLGDGTNKYTVLDFNAETASEVTDTFTATFAGSTAYAIIFLAWIKTENNLENIIDPLEEKENHSNFLVKSDNGYLYWFTNNKVHRYGDDGLETEVLLFPEHTYCVDAVETQSKLYLGVQSTEKVTPGSTDTRMFNADILGIYAWDRITQSYSMANYVPIYGAKSIKRVFINAEGELRVITKGEDNFTEIRGIVGGKLKVLFKLGINAFPNYRDSVDVTNNHTAWLGADGIIYALGTPVTDSRERLYKIGDISSAVTGGSSIPGILMSGNINASIPLQAMYVSFDDTGNRLKKVYHNATDTVSSVAQVSNNGNVKTLVQRLPMLCNIKSLDIVNLPKGTANDATKAGELLIYFNNSSTPWATKIITRNDLVKGYISYEINKSYVNTIQLGIKWEANNMSTNDFLPAHALVIYESTPTR